VPVNGETLQAQTGEITLLLEKWRLGESSVFEELMPLVYPHLRQVAAAYIRRERNPDLLQATVLVHELYLKLLNQKKVAYEDRLSVSDRLRIFKYVCEAVQFALAGANVDSRGAR
jgi:hypothetical protein